jgi:hypothetical protein
MLWNPVGTIRGVGQFWNSTADRSLLDLDQPDFFASMIRSPDHC